MNMVARQSANVTDGPSDPTLPMVAVERSGEQSGASAPIAGRTNSWIRKPVRILGVIPLVALLVAAGGFVGLYFQPPGLQKVMRALDLEPGGGTDSPMAVAVAAATAPEPLPGTTLAAAGPFVSGTVVGLGALLPEGDIITIAPPFGAGDARVESLLVEEGDRVDRGGVLAVLDSEGQFKAALAAARANLRVREATLQQTRISVRASVDEARATLARAEVAAANAEREHNRMKSLRPGVVSESVRDDARMERDQALREVEQARATLSRYETDAIETQVDVIVAARNVDAARAELFKAAQDMEKAYIRAPRAGTVLKIHIEPGETPGMAGVMDIGNIDRMTAEVEIYETLIGAVALGDAVELRGAALPRVLHGSVSKIGLEVERQTLIDDDPAANTDARVVEVTVTLDEPSSAVASRLTGLQVLARIDVEGG